VRRTINFLVFLLVLFLAVPARAAPQVTGRSAVLIDGKNGQVLFEKDKDEKLPPASTTKILTAIIAIESGKLDDTVTVGPNPPRVDGTRVYLVEGEKIKLRELVRAALIISANDAALAIGEYLSGSGSEFARVMNAKAKEIGALNTNFVNPHGLSQDNHYTTAYDLALIGRYAMQNETFREIVQSKILDWNGQEWQTRLYNINKMLGSYEGATGIKTGYTTEAKSTIVASASRNDQDLIAVVLGASGNDLWKDAETLLDYGFQNFESIKLVDVSTVAGTVAIDAEHELTMVPKDNLFLSLPQTGAKRIESQLSLETLEAPIEKGQRVGEKIFLIDGKECARVDLLARNSIPAPKVSVINIVLYVAAGLFFLEVILGIILFLMPKKKVRYSSRRYDVRSGSGSRSFR